jgi:pilus assembly protein TadC
MATPTPKYTRNAAKPASKRPLWVLPLSAKNFLYIGIGIAVLLVGFGLLSMGIYTSWDNPLSVSVAPVVLVIGYCVLIPWAIMARTKDEQS